MPQDILDRISHTIDIAIETNLVNRKNEALMEAQISSADTITRSVQEIGKTTADTIHKNTLEQRDIETKLESRLDHLLNTQGTSSDTGTDLCLKFTDPSISCLTTTTLVTKPSRTGVELPNLRCKDSSADRHLSSNLVNKLERVGTSISAVENSLKDLSTTSVSLDQDTSKSESERAAENIIQCIWLLLSNLQLLIREFM